MPKWIWYSILTVFFWGAWGAVSKVAMQMISPMVNQVIFTLGLTPWSWSCCDPNRHSWGGIVY